MIRGTTTRFTFQLPNDIDVNKIITATATIWQRGNKGTPMAPLPIIKVYTVDNIDKENKKISVLLTPEETARFTDKLKAMIQLKVDSAGAVYGTYQQKFTVYPMYDDMVGGDIGGNVTDGSIENGWVVLDGQEIIK